MEHLLIAYDILIIIIGFAALSNAVVWALRTGQNELGNFSIVNLGDEVTPIARLQNRACAFPCTRLLSRLASVTSAFNQLDDIHL